MTDWKKLPGKVVYFPSPHTSETGSMARGERGVSYTSCLPTAGGEGLDWQAPAELRGVWWDWWPSPRGCLLGLVALTCDVSAGAGGPHLLSICGGWWPSTMGSLWGLLAFTHGVSMGAAGPHSQVVCLGC